MDDILQVFGIIFIAIIIICVLIFGSSVIMKPFEFKTCVENIEKYPAYVPYWEDKGGLNYACFVDIDENARVQFKDIDIKE